MSEGKGTDGEDTALPPPEGCKSMFISLKNMERMGLKTGPNVKDVVDFKKFNTEAAKKEIIDKGFYSEFHAFRDELSKYTEEDILVIADHEEKYGQNWFICLTAAAYQEQWNEMQKEQLEKEAEEKRLREAEEARLREEAELAARIYRDEPLIPKPYESESAAATEEEVQNLTTAGSRPLLALQIVRKRRFFGRPSKLRDKEGGEMNASDFRQQRNPNYNTKRRELDVGLQSCTGLVRNLATVTTQTSWWRPVNDATQTEPRQMPEDAEEIVASANMMEFLQTVAPRCEHALQQNETLNIFEDELNRLDDQEMVVVGNAGENTIRESRTFMDLEFSNNTSLSCIDWHPTVKSWLAASTSMNWAFEERVDHAGRAVKSHILVYNFSEFSSQIVLEAPYEVLTFRWNPTDPTQIAAGCITGQVLLFDLTPAADLFNRNSKRKGEKQQESDKALRIRPSSVSTIDQSHRRPIHELAWLPADVDVSAKYAKTVEGTEATQFMTIAGDGQVAVWDTRYKEKVAKKAAVSASASGQSAKVEEVPWVPAYRCSLAKGASELGLCRVNLNPKDVLSTLYCATEDGEVVYADWSPERRSQQPATAGAGAGAAEGEGADDDGPPQRVQWTVMNHHHRPVLSLCRSPFFNDILLSVGDWCFSLWKEGLETPLFTSPESKEALCGGRWSPTRPAVVFITKSDGAIDVWDLLDQTHKPSFTASVVSVPLTSVEFRPHSVSKTGRASAQVLAAGDAMGNLHVLDVPPQLRWPTQNEQSLMQAYLVREEERVHYCEKRAEVRGKEKEAADAAAAIEESEAERIAAMVAEGVDLDAVEEEKKSKEREAAERLYKQLEKQLIEELAITPEYIAEARAVDHSNKMGDTIDLDDLHVEFSLSNSHK